MRMLTGSIALAALSATSVAFPAETDWSKIDQMYSRPATVSGAVHRYGFPRLDLKVTLDGVSLKPGFALGGWLAFEPMGDKTMMMGDLVLTESEIQPVMTKLLAAGVEVTAVHNHLLRANPPIFYMHVAGEGELERLARAARVALEQSKTPLELGGAPPSINSELGFDAAEVDNAIGAKGRNNGGVYQFSVPRSGSFKQDGMDIPPAMGTAIGINFQPTGSGKAAITGDFVALAAEVNPLVKALSAGGIEVTAIHNHMLNEEPRAFFIHFWANDDALKLAHGLHEALQTLKVAQQ